MLKGCLVFLANITTKEMEDKSEKKRLEDIPIVQDFHDVFPDDLPEAVFQLLKQKLCSAPILALPEGSEDFVVYCDALIKGLGVVLMQRDKIRYHPGKENVVADALSRKERIKPLRV
ncbi:putative reverse transcriptase domain-containing protein [Tanacetum coccineum]